MSRACVKTESTNRYGTAIHPTLPNEIVGYTGFIACVYIYDITLSHTSALFGFSERATSSWRLDDGSVTSSADPKAEIARLRFN
ncbi:Uncharacterized protein DBV15_07385 [Temnothorax longispinosus]|uniref:Uncharacterized protein n=1 Tax=Temnothorax longispinosus TaxID=300112 RepID=A0A4S2KZX8_9HYME|nr:Uncharacterized protein DBV15_07385 [Temnothorax longispinosus]